MLMATGLAAVATLALVAQVCPAGAFVRLMGNSDFYCDSEGSYCMSDANCCAGLDCVPQGFGRMQGGGGICQRGESRQGAAAPASSSASAASSPAIAAGRKRDCKADGDCPAGQCCVRRSIGYRGGSVHSCDANCDYNDVSDILGDFYSRYYRRSMRGRQGHVKKAEKKHRHLAGEEDKKKKKSHN